MIWFEDDLAGCVYPLAVAQKYLQGRKMQKSSFVFVTLVTFLLLSPAGKAQNLHLVGLANMKCDDFNAAVSEHERGSPLSVYWIEYRHYIGGYLTGFNTASGLLGKGSDLGKTMTVDMMMNWMKAFCGDNSDKAINEAIQTLVQAIARKESK